MVAVLPANPPPTAQLPAWLRAAADFKELDRPELALRAYHSAAHNNLAHVLHQRGCLTAARGEIELAESMAGASALAPAPARTRALIEGNTASDATGCTDDYVPSPDESETR